MALAVKLVVLEASQQEPITVSGREVVPVRVRLGVPTLEGQDQPDAPSDQIAHVEIAMTITDPAEAARYKLGKAITIEARPSK